MSDKKQEIVDCIDSVIELLEDMRDMLDSKEPDAARGFFEASEDAFGQLGKVVSLAAIEILRSK